MFERYLVLSILIAPAWAQTPTAIDLKAQTKNVDFTGAASTRPFKSGLSLPATCAVGEMFYLSSATAGTNVFGCTAANTWTVEAGAGAQSASQLADLAVSRVSATLLTIGANCSVAAPCNTRFGSATRAYTASTSVTISAGSGTAFIYLDPGAGVVVGHNLTVNCASGCIAAPGVSAFPANSIPLFTWSATNGTWDAAGGTDWRAFQSTTNVAAGMGLLSATANGVSTLSIDPTQVGLWAPVPASSSSACATGAWSMDGSYFYLCVAANTWRRAALSTW
ncbi:MAG TPA: hypothetical protein VKX49_25625 [Bryobacteraceae bacterium]|nr:hypothetical protein [Bryobacteraceae bacterium]